MYANTLVPLGPRRDGDGEPAPVALRPGTSAVTVHGAPGHNRWGVAETPFCAKSKGGNVDCRFMFKCRSPAQGVL